ncbi:MAG: cbb3-type cytochrome oxidase assembly protein CcoS [Nitrospirae bacterium]|nr:cbb3-type cytochrome oxidase assembly protein CcoS [Nitrospirota bacterium]
MLDSMVPLIIISLAFGLAAWLIFMWAVKTGQFDDIEGPKHRMLDDDDEVRRDGGGGKKEDKDDK